MFDYSHGTSKTLSFDSLPPFLFPCAKTLERRLQLLSPFSVKKWMLSSYKFMDNEQIERILGPLGNREMQSFKAAYGYTFISMNHGKGFRGLKKVSISTYLGRSKKIYFLFIVDID